MISSLGRIEWHLHDPIDLAKRVAIVKCHVVVGYTIGDDDSFVFRRAFPNFDIARETFKVFGVGFNIPSVATLPIGNTENLEQQLIVSINVTGVGKITHC